MGECAHSGGGHGTSFRTAKVAFRVRRGFVLLPSRSAVTTAYQEILRNMSTQWSSEKVRQTFVDYYCKTRSHTHWPSSPVVPHHDPTLLFANAGMNQFKPIFLGQADPSSPLYPLKRAANSQKCIRAGGKHNDLDDVGKDTYHHTFFEMLGNWSFGDYFKKEAIDWAWELLTQVYMLPGERLYATYFGGNESLNLPADDEARLLWLQYLPPERVLPFGMKENFWEMGETGPCGPCSEIHFDRDGGRDASSLVNCDDPTVIEIWNLVFMQFNREADRSLRLLPAKHVDTGMGMERLTSILQGVRSNYDTDIFMCLFDAIQRVTGARRYQGLVGADDTQLIDTAYRVVADHIRTLSFAIADGCVPSNDGRGYVLRRILRRGVRYGRQKLGAPKGFFAMLVQPLVEKMGPSYPELVRAQSTIQDVIEDEETQFNRTLDKGEAAFSKLAAEIKAAGGKVVSGASAFLLYDSYGFPVDLTEIMAAEAGLVVDKAGYIAEMERAKERSRAAAKKGDASRIVLQAEQTDFLTKNGVPKTADDSKYIWEDVDAKLVAIYSGSEFVQTVEEGKRCALIFDQSNFYAESGGQVGDQGLIRSTGNGPAEFAVQDVQSYGGYVIHIGAVVAGSFAVGSVASLSVDYELRKQTAANHSCTHLLNFALRSVLGASVDQKGSLVDPLKLRFDFNHNGPVAVEKLAEVEKIVRDRIAQDVPVHSRLVPLPQAQKIAALRAVFGETYPDPVRILSVGADIPEVLAAQGDQRWFGYSIELCGGTHLNHTAQALDFALISEEGIAKGIRRIAAVTRDAARNAIIDGQDLLQRAKQLAAAPAGTPGLSAKLNELAAELKQMSVPLVVAREIAGAFDDVTKKLKEEASRSSALKKKALSDWAEQQAAAADAGNLRVVFADVPEADGDAKNLGAVVDVFKAKSTTKPALFLTSALPDHQKVLAFAFVPEPTDKLNAKDWVAQSIQSVGGRGGGKADVAQGTFNNTDGAVTKVLNAAVELGRMIV